MPSCLETTETQILLRIKAVPGAPKTQVLPAQAGRLRVKIAAPPEDGKANAELCGFFAKTLGCPKKSVSLHSGAKSRLKTLSFPPDLREKLETLVNACT
ncbi:MAG: DUF167 domain-containing protein [Spirochaetaceae bacterium]|jgi:uncharacterized protein (TIGR00251 family)|nr:DUF167 domain-containing protein [Spirochaetaceae bacterium]